MAKTKKTKKTKPKSKVKKPKKSKNKNSRTSRNSKTKQKRKAPKSKTRRKRRKKRKLTKPVFQARPKDEPPPAEFNINIGTIIQDEAYATILARLNDALANLPDGYLGHVSVVPMADGSVDGELYVTVPEGREGEEVEFDLHEAFGAISVGTQYWISTGARWLQTTDDESYRRNKGMTEVGSNYQRATRANIVEEHLILRRHILPGMEQREEFKGNQPHSIYVRLHWNPEGQQPKR